MRHLIVKSFLMSFLALTPAASRGDTVKLKDGTVFQGVTVLARDDSRARLLQDYAVLTVESSQIDSIEKTASNPLAKRVTTHDERDRLPAWRKLLQSLADKKWAAGIEQVPASVIDNGVFKDVPYLSFQSGEDIEFNVYGDPDSPSAIEIGLYGSLKDDRTAQARCRALIQDLLSEKADRESLAALELKPGKTVRENLTIELTPADAPDAYGGWWISIYSERAIAASRAGERELPAITEPRSSEPVVVPTEPASPPIPPLEPRDPPSKPVPNRITVRPVIVNAEETQAWRPTELDRKPIRQRGSGGTVYVKGYTRKDGTYVRPHTRRHK